MNASERRDFATGKRTLQQIAASRPAPKTAPAPAASATPVPAPQAAPAAPAPAETPAGEPEAAVTPDAPAAESDTPAAAGEPGTPPTEAPDRFRFKGAEDQAIALLAKTKGISLLEAADLYRGKPAAAPEAAAAATPAPVEDPDLKQYDTSLTELETTLTKLSEDRKKAREDVDMEKADSLSDQIADVRTQIGLLKNERQGYVRNRETAVVQSLEQKVDASASRVLETYPELKAEGSLHRLAFDAYVTKAMADPTRAKDFSDPTWPERLGTEFAEKHGLKKPAGQAPAAAPSPGTSPARSTTPAPTPGLRPRPQQVPGAKSLTSADGNSPSAPVMTPEQLRADLARMTPAQRRALVTQVRR